MAAVTDDAFLRLRQIIGDPKRGIAPLIPVSKSSWWDGCKRGVYPKPHKLGPRTTVWRKAEVLALIERKD